MWVNESFVTPVASLPAGAMLELKADQFYDRDGRMLPSVSDVNRVQLQSVGKLFNLKVQDKAQQPELNK